MFTISGNCYLLSVHGPASWPQRRSSGQPPLPQNSPARLPVHASVLPTHMRLTVFPCL